ncbi:MAG: hypothetical protein AAF480_05750 [Actinomycetota bacterium]
MSLRARLWMVIGALTIGALAVTGCGSSPDGSEATDDGVAATEEDPTVVAADGTDDAPPTDDDEAANAEQQEPAPTETPADRDEGTAGVERRDPTLPFAADVTYDPNAMPLLRWFTPFDPGTYRTGALGTPMSFTATETLATQPNGSGMFAVTDVRSQAPDQYELLFMRVSHFSDPGAPNTPLEEQEGWPADDFDGWLDNLHEGVIATDPVETAINGLPALSVDLQLADDMECGWVPGFCAGLAVNHDEHIKALNKGSFYRLWFIEQAEEDPLLIVSAISSEDQAPWLDQADAVLETVAFGQIAPNPVQLLSPGPTRLGALGGVQMDVPDDFAELTAGLPLFIRPWTGRQFSFMPMTELRGGVYFLDQPHSVEGIPLASPDEVVAELVSNGGNVTEIGPATIDGIDARVFDFTTDRAFDIMLRYSPLDLADSIWGWDAPAAGRLWVIDHPERGLMMVSAHAFEDVDTVLPAVNDLADVVVQSLSFTG